MRAAVLRTLGSPPEHADHPDPVAGPGTTLVRVTAAPIVPLDLLCATGTSYLGAPAVPYVPGVQGVGMVERSAAHAAGTRVWFATRAGMAPGDGGLAELCAVPDEDVVAVPEGVPDAHVAALGLSAVAGWLALTWRGGFRPGERVLVLGGGGAVGQVATGAARALGAARVVALGRSPQSRERAVAAGADVAVAPTGDVAGLARRLREAAGGEGYDVVVDGVFGAAAEAATQALAPGGRLVNLGGSGGDEATFSSAVLRGRAASVLGYTNNALTPRQRADALGEVLGHAARGRVAVAHEVRPLTAVTEAWEAQRTGRAGVRLVLSP